MENNEPENKKMPDPESLYPCEYVLKVVGHNHPDLEDEILAVLDREIENFELLNFSKNDSKNGTYKSLTYKFNAASHDEIQRLYDALGKHELVKWVL